MKEQIVKECSGCEHIVNEHCAVWLSPYAKWSLGQCPNDTKFQKKAIEEQKVNPLKASKRRGRRK